MFERSKVLFLYCVSPVHVGSGTALGAIDNPIARERHTGLPYVPGSGLKGALRAAASESLTDAVVDRWFGPESSDASEHAGNVAFGDATLALFPIRSLKGSYVYATSPLLLGRLRRLLAVAGSTPEWTPPAIANDECLVGDEGLLANGRLVLESFAFDARKGDSAAGEIGRWFSERALPDDEAFSWFRNKIERHTVVLSDDRLAFFARHATVVEPHVRIEDETGTADDGGLFSTESLPPECVLVAITGVRQKEAKGTGEAEGQAQSSEDAVTTPATGPSSSDLSEWADAFDRRLVQVGGDVTSGRGQVLLHFVSENRKS